MDSSELKEIQGPLKEKYKAEPSSAFITLKATSIPGEGITCSIETGKSIAKAGLHPLTGGDGMSLCSGDMLLEALAACAGVTFSAVATAIEFKYANASINVEGDLDFRGTLGVDKSVPVGFQAIRLHFNIQTSETPERIQSLIKLTERYCVVLQTLQKGINVTVSY